MAVRQNVGGMRAFTIVWLGQLVSLIGSGLTSFALGVWVFEKTNSATDFALIYLFTELPGLLIAPFAGVLVDRHDRRLVMILSDAVAALSTLSVVLLALNDQLAVWHVYVVVSVASLARAFQVPAYLASIPLLVPKESLGRVNGLMQTAQAAQQVVAPALAGFLFVVIKLAGVALIDVITFVVGVAALLVVSFPRLDASAVEQAAKESFVSEAAFGWRYIRARPGMLAILIVIAIFFFFLSIIGAMITPMILSFTTATMLGILTSIGGVGMLVGGFVMSAWGGPKRRIYGVLGFLFIAGFFLILHGLRPSALLIGLVAFPFFFTIPFILGSNDVIWQTKTAVDVQGRVLATREMLIRSMLPLGYFLAGPLADQVFEPLLAPGGALAGSLGQLIGVGPGRGIAFMFIIGGALIMLVAVAGYLYPRLRFVEDEIPDAILEQTPDGQIAGETAAIQG